MIPAAISAVADDTSHCISEVLASTVSYRRTQMICGGCDVQRGHRTPLGGGAECAVREQ